MLFLRLFKESILLAFNALVVNKLRTFLSLLGITIGIFAIISVFTAIDSLELNIRGSVESLGNNVIFIQKWPWGGGGETYPWWTYMKRPTPKLEELAELQRRSSASEAIAFMVSSSKTVKYLNNSVENTALVAASHDYDKIFSFMLSDGRYFTQAESHSGKNIAILGSRIAAELYGINSPLGKTMKALGRKFTVIGVFKVEGESILGRSRDDQVVIPVNSVKRLLAIHKRHLEPIIMVKAKNGVSNPELKDELRGIMRSIRKLKPIAEDNFALNETSIISNSLDEIFRAIGIGGWLIGGFSILVGGFGIANIMFVSVKERTGIIGIQKSLGAKNYFVLLQFLFESVILCIIGGAFGLLIVYAGTLVANSFIEMRFVLTFSNIFLGIGVSAIIGVVSGFVPAYTAAHLDPVVAIRTNQ